MLPAIDLAPTITPANIVAALAIVNFAAFALFGIDKVRARNRHWRVKESTLLTLALLGGSPGAYAGRRVFRHKTRKEPFNSNLTAIVVLQVLGIGGAIGWFWLG